MGGPGNERSDENWQLRRLLRFEKKHFKLVQHVGLIYI